MMKKTYILTTLFFALAIGGCKKQLDQSVNPNAPSVAAPATILSGAEEVTAVRVEGDYTTFGIWLGYYAPSGNFVPVSNTETYTITTASQQTFNSLYSNLANYNFLITKAASDPTLNNFAAISKIMMAFDYQTLVDTYNDVPYSQALNSAAYLFPAYDQGPAIYADLELKLDDAIALINSSTSATSPGASDIIFGGNMTKWKKFANTLKLRIAIRQSNITANKPGLITELAKTSAEGYLDDATFVQTQPGYLASDANGGQQNPYYKTFGFSAAGAEQGGHAQDRANTFFINFLTSRGNDTVRLKQIYAPVYSVTESSANAIKYASNPSATPPPPNNAAHILGNIFGNDATNTTNANTSALGPGIIPGPTAPATIMGGAEACYLLSEGIVSGLIPGTLTGGAGTAQDYYQRGIAANFVALGSTAALATTYYSQPIVDVNWVASLANLQRAIITQKYIALFGFNIFEAYNEYRRTGYPDLSGARSTTSGALTPAGVPVPYRIYFPNTEFTSNAAAVNAEPAVNPYVTKIFWAK